MKLTTMNRAARRHHKPTINKIVAIGTDKNLVVIRIINGVGVGVSSECSPSRALQMSWVLLKGAWKAWRWKK